MIEIRDLVKCFGEKRALDGLSLTVREGVAFGLLGRNGAGKTTTIRILMNIFREDAGAVLIDGVPAHKEPKRIGYLPEERGLYPKRTILEQMVYLAKLKGVDPKRVDGVVRDKLAEMDATEYTDSKLDTLSKGNQQKIQLAVALLGDPSIVILDEPFSGLDPINAQILKDAVRRQVDLGKTVIFSSHQMAQVEEFCDDIVIIDRGRAVLEGNLAQIKRSYPRDRLLITAEGEAPALEAALGALPYVKEAVPKGGGFVVTLADERQRTALLRALDEKGVPLDGFSVVEPSLEQIFIEKAGEPDPEAEAPEAAAGGKKRRGLFGRRAKP
ncbi:MAG: ATP-binding cassette domain-containing protein [Clostridiales Family XIII bacterium]|jgi:ABC-2 type transport system ATP-binding protein|nr:ATP-binding cassette domain-containing protein [Clostridiales Family XIII bacterium]